MRHVPEPRSAQGWVALAAGSCRDDAKLIEEAANAAERIAATGERFKTMRAWAHGCGAGRRAMAEALLTCSQAEGGIAAIDGGDRDIERRSLPKWWSALTETVHDAEVQLLFTTHRHESVRAAAETCVRAGVECAVQAPWRRDDGSRGCATCHDDTLKGALELGLRLV